MIKPIASTILLSSLAFFAQAESLKSVASSESEQVRLVISGSLSTVSAQSAHYTSSMSRQAEGLSTMVVNKDEAEAVTQLLMQQPGVRAVEVDLVTSNPPMPKISQEKMQALTQELAAQSAVLSGDQPNDPEYINQYTWADDTATYKGQHDVLNAYKQSTQNQKVRIGMTDSGFYDREDINYAGGYNFTTINGGTVSPLFFEPEWNPGCTNPHGGSVAHIIGAETDNGVGVAGIVDADLYAVRVMDCGTGLLSEMATGIRWLAGDTSLPGDITPIDAPVHMINVSMGAQVGDKSCPTYVQDAINYAYNKGIAVFAAAGNDSINIDDYTPANCDNVITVSSVDRYGVQSDFSNYGLKADVGALGELVRSEGTTGYSFWFGTSFATPNTLGIAALAKQANPSLTVNELFSYVKSTTRAYEAGQTTNDLGTGVVDANAMMTQVNADLNVDQPLLSPAMDSSERCQKAALAGVPFNDDNGDPVSACAIFELDTSFVDAPALGFENRSLYRVPEGTSLTVSNGELVKASTEEKFIAYNLDPATYDYGYAACDSTNTSCESSELIPLNDDAIDSSRYCIEP